MSVLVIGGDYVEHIKGTLFSLGADSIEHWDGRAKDITRKTIPSKTECVVFLTSYLNHSAMNYFKKQALKRNITTIYAKRSVSCVFHEFCKTFGTEKAHDHCPYTQSTKSDSNE